MLKTFKLSIITALLGTSLFAKADIITDSVQGGDSKLSIKLDEQQKESEKIKSMDLTDPNFNPSDYFSVKNKDLYKFNLPVNGGVYPISPRVDDLNSHQIKSIEKINEYYSNVVSNCRGGQSINRSVIDSFNDEYAKNQSSIGIILENVTKGYYSDNNLLSIELLLRSQLDAYRCVYLNAAVNLVEQQDYVTQVNENINTLQKRNFVLRNTFDTIRYIYLELPIDQIIKNRIY